jgi:hypothetical protein
MVTNFRFLLTTTLYISWKWRLLHALSLESNVFAFVHFRVVCAYQECCSRFFGCCKYYMFNERKFDNKSYHGLLIAKKASSETFSEVYWELFHLRDTCLKVLQGISVFHNHHLRTRFLNANYFITKQWNTNPRGRFLEILYFSGFR